MRFLNYFMRFGTFTIPLGTSKVPQKEYTWKDFEQGRQQYFEYQTKERQRIEEFLQKKKLAFLPAEMSAVIRKV